MFSVELLELLLVDVGALPCAASASMLVGVDNEEEDVDDDDDDDDEDDDDADDDEVDDGLDPFVV